MEIERSSSRSGLARSQTATGEDYTDVIDYASCTGRGVNIWNRYGAKMFRNFRCYVETDDGQAYYIAFHVRGKFAYDYDYLYDAQ
jgi:hypothetical protein